MSDERERNVSTRSRRTVTSTVAFGSDSPSVGDVRKLDLPGEEMNFVSGHVDIEVSGASDDYPFPARVSREIEAAVEDVLERTDRIGADTNAQRRTPDDRPITDIGAMEHCNHCGTKPAPIILTNGEWECYQCGGDPDEPKKVMADGGQEDPVTKLLGELDDASETEDPNCLRFANEYQSCVVRWDDEYRYLSYALIDARRCDEDDIRAEWDNSGVPDLLPLSTQSHRFSREDFEDVADLITDGGMSVPPERDWHPCDKCGAMYSGRGAAIQCCGDDMEGSQ